MQRTDREPCPWRIVDDAGGAFVFGLVGGTVWHTIGGARNAPKGQRIAQALSRARARVPILGGSFAVWGVLYSCCDCTLTYYRKKEDPWNAIFSGAATGGILAARAGLKAAGRSAFAGGMILAAIEGLNLVLMRVLMPSLEQQQLKESGAITVDPLLPPMDPSRPRISRAAQNKSLWETTPSSSPSPFASVFNTETAAPPAWETPSFASPSSNFSAGYDSGSSSSSEPTEQPKSSWKFW